MCRYGAECKEKNSGKCHFVHPIVPSSNPVEQACGVEQTFGVKQSCGSEQTFCVKQACDAEQAFSVKPASNAVSCNAVELAFSVKPSSNAVEPASVMKKQNMKEMMELLGDFIDSTFNNDANDADVLNNYYNELCSNSANFF